MESPPVPPDEEVRERGADDAHAPPACDLQERGEGDEERNDPCDEGVAVLGRRFS